MDFPESLSRRNFIKNTGSLIIGFNLADPSIVPELLAQAAVGKVATPTPDRLDDIYGVGLAKASGCR